MNETGESAEAATASLKHFDSAPMSRRRLIGGGATLAAGAAALALAGCGDDSTSKGGTPATAIGAGPTPTPSAEKPQKGGTLRMGQVTDVLLNTGYPYALLPQNRLHGYAGVEPLVRYRDSIAPEKVLVDQFEYNTDHSKLTLSLKPGLTFHNGAAVTVDDIFFAIDVINDPKKYNVTATFQLATFAKFITDRKKVDQRTAEFTFDKPRFNMTDLFAQLDITQAASYPDLLSGKSVQGTGPYMWDSWVPGQSLRLKANPNWHLSSSPTSGGGPWLDAIELKLFADQDSLGLAFESGDVELVLGVSASVAKRFRDKQQTRLTPKSGVAYVGANVTNPLLKDKRVRQAMFLALDRKRFAEELGEGFTVVTAQPWPESSPAFDKSLQATYYDPAKAKDLLKQAGFTQDKPLKIEYSGTAYPTQAPVWKENFEAIGVKIELTPLEGNAFTAKFQARQLTDLFVSAHAFADMSPLTNFQQTFPFRLPNISYFEEPDYVQFISDLEKVDPLSAEAKALYQKFNQNIWLEYAWMLPFSGNERIDLVGDKVRGLDGYFITVTGDPNFGKIWKKA